jgi:hypothetical protein
MSTGFTGAFKILIRTSEDPILPISMLHKLTRIDEKQVLL